MHGQDQASRTPRRASTYLWAAYRRVTASCRETGSTLAQSRPGGVGIFRPQALQRRLGVEALRRRRVAKAHRDAIVERVRSGLARAKAEQDAGKPRRGKNGKLKKAIGRPRVSPETEAQILAMRAEGKGMTAISKGLRVGGSTVKRVLTA